MIFAIDLGSLIMKSVLWSEKLKCYDVGQLYRAVCPVEGEAERLLGFICQLFGGMWGGVCVCVCVGGGGNRSAHSPPSPSPSPPPPPPSSLLLLLPWPLSDHCCRACRPESSRVLLEGRCVQDARSSLSAVKGEPDWGRLSSTFQRQGSDRTEEERRSWQRRCVKTHVFTTGSFAYSLATSDLFWARKDSFPTHVLGRCLLFFCCCCCLFFSSMDLALWAAGCSGLCPEGGSHTHTQLLPSGQQESPAAVVTLPGDCFWWIYKLDFAFSRIQQQQTAAQSKNRFGGRKKKKRTYKSSKWGFQYPVVSTGTRSDLSPGASHLCEGRGRGKVGEIQTGTAGGSWRVGVSFIFCRRSAVRDRSRPKKKKKKKLLNTASQSVSLSLRSLH